MNAVLLGYGTVGKGVEKLCRNVKGLNLDNVFVLPEFEDLPYFTNDGMGLVTRPDVDIVFECLSGTEPSNTLITAALEAGKHVITSNKATVAPNLERYVQLAKENGGSIQVEASVAGGIPFLDSILKLKQLEELDGYEGIFNGTSNFILDKMQKTGAELEDVLKEAQALGYAEANPAADVEGWDVYYKTNITNMMAYHTKNDGIPDPVGILQLNSDDVKFAREHNKVIRHISKSIQKDGKYASIIAPAFLDQEDYLANVPSNYNAQLIYAPSFEKIGSFGQGAGQMATAQAMLANAIDTLNGTEREIVLDTEKKNDQTLLEEKLVVRSAKPLDFVPFEKEEGPYRFTGPVPVTLVEEIKKADPDAMVALWREAAE